ERGALPWLGADFDGAAQGANARHGDVDTHAAAGDIGHGFRRRESGPRQHAQQLIVRERLDVRSDDALALRLLEDFPTIDPPAVVRDADRHARPLPPRRPDDLALWIFPVALALGGRPAA